MKTDRLQLKEVLLMENLDKTVVRIVKDKKQEGCSEEEAIKQTVEFLQRVVVEYNIDPNITSKKDLIERVSRFYEEDKERGK